MKIERLAIALIVAIGLGVVWLHYKAVSDCEKAGGRAVKSASVGVECIK